MSETGKKRLTFWGKRSNWNCTCGASGVELAKNNRSEAMGVTKDSLQKTARKGYEKIKRGEWGILVNSTLTMAGKVKRLGNYFFGPKDEQRPEGLWTGDSATTLNVQ